MNPELDPRLKPAPSPTRAWVNPSLHPIGCVGAPLSTGAAALEDIAAAEAWLREQGCTRARGPIEGSTFFAYRANMGPMNRPPFLGEPTFDPAPFAASGYTPIAWYASALADNASQINYSEPAGKRLNSEGWRLVGLEELGQVAVVRSLGQPRQTLACLGQPRQARQLSQPSQPMG